MIKEGDTGTIEYLLMIVPGASVDFLSKASIPLHEAGQIENTIINGHTFQRITFQPVPGSNNSYIFQILLLKTSNATYGFVLQGTMATLVNAQKMLESFTLKNP